MTEDWDVGDIIDHVTFDISEYETHDSLMSKSFEHVIPLLKQMRAELDTEKLTRQKQEGGSYFKERDQFDLQIDWSLTASEIDHIVRINHSITPPFTIIANRLITISEVKTSYKSEQGGENLN